MRQPRFGRFRIWKNAWLIGPLVDRRAANLGEPNRFRLWNPWRRVREFYSANAFAVWLRPEIPQVLLTEDPGLTEPVSNCGSRLRVPRRIVDIEPIVSLTACKVVGEIFEMMRAVGQSIVELTAAITPVGQRCVVVDTNRIDRGRSP